MVKSEFNSGAAKPWPNRPDIGINVQVTRDHVGQGNKLDRCAGCAIHGTVCDGIYLDIAGNHDYYVGQTTISDISSLPEDCEIACLPGLTRDQLARLPNIAILRPN